MKAADCDFAMERSGQAVFELPLDKGRRDKNNRGQAKHHQQDNAND